MQQVTPSIDYQVIANAKLFYEAHGFKELAVPWIIGYEAYGATRPSDRKEFYTLGGYLNASGEQSFLELMLQDVSITRNFCVTSCFRDEPVLDSLHQRYFVKLELIDTNVSLENLHAIIKIAQLFFETQSKQKIKTRIVQTDQDGLAFDILDDCSGIELGSYGIRTYKTYRWIYATGVALPRFTHVIKNNYICTSQLKKSRPSR